MADCVFCKIAAGEIPCKKAYEDEEVLAFHDIHPEAPVHILLIPKAHVAAGAAEIDESNSAQVAGCLVAAARLAKELGLTEGFRLVTNNGPHACQTVPHLHFHLLAGKQMRAKMD
ncbi:MAG: histidine triad nucleotide-binding protein [Oscillospiraceae bacterium]|jgi:histidine triad (HIT) family protein|nr:histidine triad nucleotide-binding protein [Oscillospiraceae bacterium]